MCQLMTSKIQMTVSVLPHVSPKEAFLGVGILKNYLIQHKKNIPDLVYALLKIKDE
ncbi:hypothetical protein Gogos_022111, partial [Gossypium gossypioides]|nr:hypothetical protein [Gossypium gossypioides]